MNRKAAITGGGTCRLSNPPRSGQSWRCRKGPRWENELMSGALFFCLIVGAGLLALWFVRRILMLAVLTVVVLGAALVGYLVIGRGLEGYDQLYALPVVAATYGSLLAIGLRAAYLVVQGQGEELSTPVKLAGLALAFGVFVVLFVANI